MASGVRVAVLLALVTCGGAKTPALDPVAIGYSAAAATAFQTRADEGLGGVVSPLSAVDAWYLTVGESVTLGVLDGRVRAQPQTPGERVRIEVPERGGIAVHRTAPGSPTRTHAGPGEIPLGRFVLAASAQSGGARVVVHDPDAPGRVAFAGRPWFAVDGEAIVVATLRNQPDAMPVTLRTSRGLDKAMPRVAELRGTFRGGSVVLDAFGEADGEWLVPFTDPSNGAASYAVGRYLTVQPDARAGAAVVLDFNRATNPWCAYSELYNCPIPPANSAVSVPVLAGERAPASH